MLSDTQIMMQVWAEQAEEIRRQSLQFMWWWNDYLETNPNVLEKIYNNSLTRFVSLD